MKIFFYILLFALIFCNNIEKKEKINLLDAEDDVVDKFFADIINILNNCALEEDCVFSQLYMLLGELSDEDTQTIYDYLNDDDDCKNVCADELSEVGASSVINEICYYLCD